MCYQYIDFGVKMFLFFFKLFFVSFGQVYDYYQILVFFFVWFGFEVYVSREGGRIFGDIFYGVSFLGFFLYLQSFGWRYINILYRM